jgi:hypothetical protein
MEREQSDSGEVSSSSEEESGYQEDERRMMSIHYLRVKRRNPFQNL